MTVDTEVFDRRRGALVGLAIGDALGQAVEFKAPGTFQPVTGYRGDGPHPIGPGDWTDDTSLALALADSIVEVGWNLGDQARRYLSWMQTGQYSVNGRVFDIGNATRHALSTFSRTGDAFTSGPDSEHAAGNGSIMRLAPVPAGFLDTGIDEVIRLSIESSLPTHRAPQCLSACAWLGATLAALMEGGDRDEVLHPDGDVLRRVRVAIDVHPAVAEVAAGSYRRLEPPAIKGSGYVVKSLEAALWAFVHADSFEDAVLRAVNLGDDADTTGAVCGQLAGAHWGYSGIPAHLIDGLAHHDWIDGLAQRLATRSRPAGSEPQGSVTPRR